MEKTIVFLKFQDVNGEGKKVNFFAAARMEDEHGLKNPLPTDAYNAFRFYSDDNSLSYKDFSMLVVDLMEIGYSVKMLNPQG